MKNKTKRSTLIKKLDSEFSRYIRQSRAINGFTACVTCGKVEEWKNQDCGHFISRIHFSVRWDENNVAPQCKYCNRYCQGEQFLFSKHLGLKLSNKLLIKSKQIVKFTDVEIKEMINYYKQKNSEF